MKRAMKRNSTIKALNELTQIPLVISSARKQPMAVSTLRNNNNKQNSNNDESILYAHSHYLGSVSVRHVSLARNDRMERGRRAHCCHPELRATAAGKHRLQSLNSSCSGCRQSLSLNLLTIQSHSAHYYSIIRIYDKQNQPIVHQSFLSS